MQYTFFIVIIKENFAKILCILIKGRKRIMKYYVIPDLDNIEKYLELSKKYNLGFEYNDFFMPKLLDDK